MRIVISKMLPIINSKISIAINGNPFLEPLRDICSLINNKLKTADPTCPTKLIRLTCQNFKEMISLVAILPTMNWKINGSNRMMKSIYIIIRFWVIFYSARNVGHSFKINAFLFLSSQPYWIFALCFPCGSFS